MFGRKKEKKAAAAFTAAAWGVVFGIGIFLYVWTTGTEREAHYTPEYRKENLAPYIRKERLEEEDYELLFRQTGLAPRGVDALWKKDRRAGLLELQENFFSRVETECSRNTVVSREESLTGRPLGQRIPAVEKGDILINFNCHVLGWRSGHAGIVTDAEKRQTLEAQLLGTDTAILSLDRWERYPSFAVLRLKGVSAQRRGEIADYAAENLTDVPYSLTAGLWPARERYGKETETNAAGAMQGTQCAHLVWYAYAEFGYDLDSDGGRIVTPRDLFDSPLLEIVQVYGMEVPEAKNNF